MARLPPSRHPLHCGLRIPDLRARDDSPLNRSCHQRVPAICLTRSLPAQRIRRCGPNATFRTQLQQCDGDWWPLSPRCYRVAHAARLGTDEICDTVRLDRHVVPRLGKRSVAAVTQQDIEDFMLEVARDSGKPTASRTVSML